MMTSIKSQKCFERVLFPRAHTSAISIRNTTSQKMIDAPEPFDVLLGRGKAIQKRPGNKLIRLLIDQNCHRYNQAPRQQKRAIANEIVQGIKSKIGKLPGRFLRLCGSAEQGEWKEVSNAIAIDKVSHIFRARRNLAQKSSSSGSLARMPEISAVAADDFLSNHEKYAFTTPTNMLGPPLLLSNLQDCQHERQPARPPTSVPTTNIPLPTSVVMLSPLKNMHYAARKSSYSIGALLSGDMMWTPPPYQRRTRPDLLQEPCHGEKGINDGLSSLEDRAAAPPRSTHYQDYYFPDQQHGSRSGNDGDVNSTTPR
jgi:hypothetical protein